MATMAWRRRDFLLQLAALAAALGPRTAVARAQTQAMPTRRARDLMNAFGLKVPIFNAGMGGTATPELAIAVTNAGGLGAIGAGATRDIVSIRDRVTRIRAATGTRPFAVNYLLAFEPVTLQTAVDAGAPVIQFAWGIPDSAMVAIVKGGGAKMGVQVAGVAGARRAIDAGADYLICQGTEAGGHVQATRALYDSLPAIVDAATSTPVLAGGGIASGAHIRRALVAGASGVLVGTRFLASKESAAHDDYKQLLARSKADDTVLTVCFQDGWINAPHRVLRNRTLDMWEAAGCPPPGKRPGEADILTTNAVTGTTKKRYGISLPGANDRGSLLDLVLYAGMGVDAIRDVPSAGELTARLWQECLDAR
jgi:nitronate monooxygenase